MLNAIVFLTFSVQIRWIQNYRFLLTSTLKPLTNNVKSNKKMNNLLYNQTNKVSNIFLFNCECVEFKIFEGVVSLINREKENCPFNK